MEAELALLTAESTLPLPPPPLDHFTTAANPKHERRLSNVANYCVLEINNAKKSFGHATLIGALSAKLLHVLYMIIWSFANCRLTFVAAAQRSTASEALLELHGAQTD